MGPAAIEAVMASAPNFRLVKNAAVEAALTRLRLQILCHGPFGSTTGQAWVYRRSAALPGCSIRPSDSLFKHT